jgi:VWFA-related protein
MRRSWHRIALFGFGMVAAVLHAQEPPAPDNAHIVLRTNAQEVVLDVVVRNRNHSLATNLKAPDFTITEDGVPQAIRSFRLARASEPGVAAPVSTPTPANATPPVSAREPNFISIVFDQMGADSRQNAQEAATEFLDQEFQSDTDAAIFSLDLRINVIHGFTSDRTALASAVRVALNGSPADLAAASANVLNETDYTLTGGPGGISLNPGIDLTKTPDFSTSTAAANPLSESQAQLAAMITDQRGMVDLISGMRAWESLQTIIRYESALPGRKTILYLSDGLIDPPGRQEIVRQVVSAANRGNVTFYCIDVRGMSLTTSNGASTGLMESAAATSRTQGTMSSSPSTAMRQAQEFDEMDQAAAGNLQLNMAELSRGTGGFAVFNTNDFKKSMQRIMEEVRTHYEISYVPQSTLYDGKYRQIKVTVDQPHLIVRTRDGYFALPQLNGQTLQPFETSALHILDGAQRQDFAFRVAPLRFKPLNDGYHFEMSFDLPVAGLTTAVDQKTHKARVHAEFLALLKDAGGQVVAKVSRQIDREVPAADLEKFRRGEMILTMPFEASPGNYTVDAVAVDPEANHASTKRIHLAVPQPGKYGISNVMVVRSIQPLSAPRDPGYPLEFAGGKVTPALDQSASVSAGIALFFVIYPDRETPGKPRVTVEFFRDGKGIAISKPDVGSPDEVNSFPMLQFAKLPAGDYVARVTVEHGASISVESTPVKLIP